MTSILSPIESEFATSEEAASYDVWFRAKVQASLDSTNPKRYSTDEVRQRMQKIIKAAEDSASGNLA
ncbi:stability determinant [Undibacterium sp. TC9W]|uniref:type II toxin-antitoxin system RelB family antitoxin n=1 Tax=Undibacterium sp. TC9W TaxID=3413053 RepID=UPI003BF03A92